ncbi:energy transducer TonB [Hephaestia mangrovi]|uniref:energy transducer TonB n=1 Tax=Hephaestia mangrovi TaxID=2873268 RepID=UPI001CA66D2B|nr:energy transducer TonB [Hephaestia mangrovi]MBY8827120.1 energy transducer TonB [Hephaestia mangrovi]
MRGRFLFGAALMSAGGVAAAAQQQPETTVQQDFDRATQLSDGTDKVAALAAWQALERRISANKRSHAIVLVRKSEVLFDLGHKDDAIAAAKAGLADLPETDHTLDNDRMRAERNLGGVAESSLDYAGAAVYYRRALPLAATPVDKLAILRGLIQTGIFTDPATVEPEFGQADTLLGQIKADRTVKAMFARLRDQWLMAQGKYDAAAKAAKGAVEDLGGLTVLTDINDAAARSDTAIALLLAGQSDEARKYMAYTGAGQLPGNEFDPGAEMTVPPCGGDSGLRPQDAAVVQFSVGDDGRVIDSQPVYAAGGGAAALAFAKAARDWSWTPEQAKKLPPFFRYSARVELRCSTAFERPSIGSYLDQDLGAWLIAKGVELPPPLTGSDIAVLPHLRERLAAQQTAQGNGALVLVPTLMAIAENAASGREEMHTMAVRAVAILTANGATPVARLAAEALVWISADAESWRAADYVRAVQPRLEDPFYATDPEARSAIRLMVADRLLDHASDRARILLQQVADDNSLAANDPLKVGALVRLASIDAADGHVDQARAAFEKTGLSADQCALLDAQPHIVSSNVGSGSFPQEARRWGFEGWTQLQFDVTADGHPKNVRAIVSYPPFVFTAAGTNVLERARFSKSYRPDGDLGCGGDTQRVKFQIQS